MNFPASFYRGNRRYVQKTLQSHEVFVIAAHARLQKSADDTFFHQNRDFLYLCGINEPDWILVITAKEEFLIRPHLHRIERLFDGGLSATQAVETSGVSQILSDAEGWRCLSTLLAKAREVQTVLSDSRLWFRTVANPAPARLVRRIRARTKAPVVTIHPFIHKRRAIKQPLEIKAIQTAISITGQTLKDIHAQLSQYKFENEIAADLSIGFIKRGSTGHAFQPIVASGLNTCTVHYRENNQPLDRKTFLLLDVGAEYQHYAADISRTYALQQTPTKRQRDIHGAVRRVQQAAIDMIRPGLLFKNYFKWVDERMGEELLKLKLINQPTTANIRKYFPYGVSHFLGLDVHDVSPNLEEFTAGMILTVEPGIHVPSERLGVRLEDNILVTANGAKNLSQSIPRSL